MFVEMFEMIPRRNVRNDPSQTKILERWTKEEIRFFEALFKAWALDLGYEHWKVLRKSDFFFCSLFQNLRLGSIEMEIVEKKGTSCRRLIHTTCKHAPFTRLMRCSFTDASWYHHLVISTDTSSDPPLNKSQDDDTMSCSWRCVRRTQGRHMMVGMANQKMARFRTHYLSNELAYVRNQNWHDSMLPKRRFWKP